jgi:hypothetical protein
MKSRVRAIAEFLTLRGYSFRIVAVARIVIGAPTVDPFETSCATGCSTMNWNG